MRESIVVTERDFSRLQALIDSSRLHRKHDQHHVDELEEELRQAQVIPDGAAPKDTVTLYSVVLVTDLIAGEQRRYQLVLPKHVDTTRNMISVLAPIGTALLGYSVGDVIVWKVPGGERRWRIDAVEHTTEPTHDTRFSHAA